MRSAKVYIDINRKGGKQRHPPLEQLCVYTYIHVYIMHMHNVVAHLTCCLYFGWYNRIVAAALNIDFACSTIKIAILRMLVSRRLPFLPVCKKLLEIRQELMD